MAGEGWDHSQQHYHVHLNLWSPAFFLREAEGQAKIYLHSPSSQFLEVLKFTSSSESNQAIRVTFGKVGRLHDNENVNCF